MAEKQPSLDDGNGNAKVEAQTSSPQTISHIRMILDQGVVTPAIEHATYAGSGTTEDPYLVSWTEGDVRNPLNFGPAYRWMIMLVMAFAVLSVSMCSSAFTGGLRQIEAQYGISNELGILAVSLFVCGFALGPLFWAPLSEMYGRQLLFAISFGGYTAFNGGVAASQNAWTILILRFFAGAFGSSPLTNAGGVIADCFPARERGLALSIFAAAPFLGPSLGPIIGGFLGQKAGWRWLAGFLALFSGLCWVLGMVFVPETYAPVLLRRRAQNLSKMTGKVYMSKLDKERGVPRLANALKSSLVRPWVLLFFEPIVLLLSLYMAIIYGTLYMLFAAYPIVYQIGRHWSEGIGGLPFIGLLVGMTVAVLYSIFIDNARYIKIADKHKGFAPAESRLPPAMIGGIALPIGMFWFAWTNSPDIHWAASVTAGIPFGFGMVLVFLSIFNYLIDSYTIFAASVLAANSVLRSLFGAAFPLFTTQMYENLGIHWASSIPAFLALACVPFPFLFHKYGAAIRNRCKFAREAEAFMNSLKPSSKDEPVDPEEEENEAFEEVEAEGAGSEQVEDIDKSSDHSHDSDTPKPHVNNPRPQLERIRTGGRASSTKQEDWDDNPFSIDRVHTRESFRRSRSASRASRGSNK